MQQHPQAARVYTHMCVFSGIESLTSVSTVQDFTSLTKYNDHPQQHYDQAKPHCTHPAA